MRISSPVNGTPLWEVLLRSGEVLLENGDLGNAEKRLLSALQIVATSDRTKDEIVRVHTRLGDLYCKMGQLRKSEQHYTAAIANVEEIACPILLRLGPILCKYARILERLGRKCEAHSIRNRAQTIAAIQNPRSSRGSA